MAEEVGLRPHPICSVLVILVVHRTPDLVPVAIRHGHGRVGSTDGISHQGRQGPAALHLGRRFVVMGEAQQRGFL